MTYFRLKFFHIFLFLGTLVIVSCEDRSEPPVVGTGRVTEVNLTSAMVPGFIIFDGGSRVKSKGICWDTSDDPIIASNRTDEGGGQESFSSRLINLTPNTIYYARAYATNRSGTGYGITISFKTRRNMIYVTTRDISSLTDISAVSGGDINADIGEVITARGVC